MAAGSWRQWLFGASRAPQPEQALLDAEAESSSWSATSLISSYGRRKYHQLVDAQLDTFMPFMRDYLLSLLVESESDEAGKQVVAGEWAQSWPDIEMDLRWKLRRKLGVPQTAEQRIIQHLRVHYWANSFPPFRGPSGCPQPYTALRARLLYWMNPADELQPAVAFYILMALNLSAVFQLCNWVMFVRFLLIDRNDEHQLVEYIISNKAYHFVVYGAIQFIQNEVAYFNCVLDDFGRQHPCSDGAPGRNNDGHFTYYIEFIFEQIRILTVWYAFCLLRKSRGGPKYMAELERARVGGAAKDVSDEALAGEFGLAERVERGGIVRFMFIYDIATFLFCYGIGFINLLLKLWAVDCKHRDCSIFTNPERGHIPAMIEHVHLFRDWRFTMTLDFSETTYSLFAFPFLLLSARPLRRYLVGSKPTGYDCTGVLRPELDYPKKVERGKVKGLEEEEARAAAKIQAHVRGNVVRNVY